ncbi:hypothetical protein DFH06DRAFT_1315478 [Mycena polygramma]|nr:hypothetical protein DFH06DRAFT_1315478 [Mycena polygramma]
MSTLVTSASTRRLPVSSLCETWWCGEMEMHYDYATIGARILAELCTLPAVPSAHAKITGAAKLAATDIDYLADSGAGLEKAIDADLVTTQRIYDSLEVLKVGELSSRALIEEKIEEKTSA